MQALAGKEARCCAGLLQMRDVLFRNRLVGNLFVLLLVRLDPLRAVEFEEGVDHNRIALDALVLRVANRSPNLNMRALIELGSGLCTRAEDDAAVPFGKRCVLAVPVLEASGSRQGERGEGAVVLGVGLSVIAEVADENCEVRFHDGVSVLNSRTCSGH